MSAGGPPASAGFASVRVTGSTLAVISSMGIPLQHSVSGRKFVRDFQVGEVILTYAALRSVSTRLRRTGEEYLVLELQDRTGSIEGRVWDIEEPMRQLQAGHYVKIKGKVEEYRGMLQVIVEKIRQVADADREAGFLESDCVASTPYDIDSMWRRLCRIVEEQVDDPPVRTLLLNILERTGSRFREYPAAQEIHHGYRGGFLEHVLSVTENCVYFSGKYEEVDKNLLIAGGILHDIGKLDELTPAPSIDYTVSGRLIGHIIMGRDLVREEAARIPGFPPQTLLLIEHMILSHQGEYEWGSPKRPKILEALILHYLDDLDAKANHLRMALQSHRGPARFTRYDRILGRVLYCREPAQPAQADPPDPEEI